jgi:hypothetical protein
MQSRRLVSILLSSLLVAAVSCGGSSPPPTNPGPEGASQTAEATPRGDVEQAGVGEDEDESTADLAEHHRHHHHAGLAMFIAMSLEPIAESSDQRDAIMKIQADIHAKLQPSKDAEKAVLLALADGVAAGNVDQAKLAPSMAQLATASANAHDAIADSLNSLHALLGPPQRQALVDKVNAHFEVWHHANEPHVDGGKNMKHGQVAALAEQLGLSADQVATIRTSYKDALAKTPKYDRAEADAHLKAFGAAFASDHFDAKELTTGGPVNAHMSTWGITRTVLLYQAAAPVLKPEQRAKAAEELRRHANYKRSDKEG